MNILYKNMSYEDIRDRIVEGEYVGCEKMDNFPNIGKSTILIFDKPPRIVPVTRPEYKLLNLVILKNRHEN